MKSITANGPSALQAVKEIIDCTPTMAEADALAFEREKAAMNILSGQCLEGIGSFLKKNRPDGDFITACKLGPLLNSKPEPPAPDFYC